MIDRPEIVCICGSARFMTEIRAANRELTFAGVIVVAQSEAGEAPSPGQKAVLDALHLRKIDLADRVLIVNPGGYWVSRREEKLRLPKRPASRSHSLSPPDASHARVPVGQPVPRLCCSDRRSRVLVCRRTLILRRRGPQLDQRPLTCRSVRYCPAL